MLLQRLLRPPQQLQPQPLLRLQLQLQLQLPQRLQLRLRRPPQLQLLSKYEKLIPGSSLPASSSQASGPGKRLSGLYFTSLPPKARWTLAQGEGSPCEAIFRTGAQSIFVLGCCIWAANQTATCIGGLGEDLCFGQRDGG